MTRGPVFEDMWKVYFAPTVADISAPTVAEVVTAGDYLGRLLNIDGVALGISQNRVGVSSIDETFEAERMGTWSASPELTLFRDDTDESDGWDVLVAGTEGFLVISPYGVPIATSKAYVFPAELGVPRPADSAKNTPQTFKVSVAATSEPDMNAVFA